MVISSSNINDGNNRDMSLEDANLALDWYAATGKLEFDLFDESITPPRQPPSGYVWVYNGKWEISEN